MSTNYERIVDALRTCALDSEELAVRTGLARRSVGQILRAMSGRGEVEQREGGLWALVDGGALVESEAAAELQVIDAEPEIDASFAVWNDGSVCIDKAGVQVALSPLEVRAMWEHLSRFMR